MRQRQWYIVAGCLGLFIDQLAKWAAVAVLSPNGTIKSWGAGFGLIAYINNQFAWSWPVPNGAVIIFTVLLLIIGGFFYFRYWRARPDLLPVFLIGSGALSNLIDRLARGGVVDYFLLPGGGVINLADILIIIGVLLLALNTKKVK